MEYILPEGKYIIGIEEFSAPVRFSSASRWQEMRNEFEAEIIRQWQMYTPNMTRDNIIGSHIFMPYDIQLQHPNMHKGSISGGDMIVSQMDRFRPTPELSNYRTPVKNLYLSSFASPTTGGDRERVLLQLLAGYP